MFSNSQIQVMINKGLIVICVKFVYYMDDFIFRKAKAAKSK